MRHAPWASHEPCMLAIVSSSAHIYHDKCFIQRLTSAPIFAASSWKASNMDTSSAIIPTSNLGLTILCLNELIYDLHQPSSHTLSLCFDTTHHIGLITDIARRHTSPSSSLTPLTFIRHNTRYSSFLFPSLCNNRLLSRCHTFSSCR